MSKVLILAFIAWIILKPLHKEVDDGDHVFAIIIIIIITIIIITIIIIRIKVTIIVYYNGG